ncbi:MAG: response regulator [Desulfurivibrio sp.]|nr:response regulator [Desulfurivibrio sp.]MBU4119611.1 response regulator [Pseudomonadota bacterium]
MPRALIIEDTPDNMRLICFILNRNGIDTIEAETGQKGIELALAKPRPDFIILDIQLPDIEGTEVLKIIRNSEANGSIPIIAMTSYAMSGDRDRLLADGCNGYIEKPIDPMTVMDQLREVLGTEEEA